MKRIVCTRITWIFAIACAIASGCDQSTTSRQNDVAPSDAAQSAHSSAPAPSQQPPSPAFFGNRTAPAAPAQPTPSSPSTTSQPDSPAPTDGPIITFDNDTIDFGTISEVEQRHATFTFANTGAKPLIIYQVKTSCGCTSARLSKHQYAPGERGQIDITLDHSAPGKQPKLVNVVSNASNAAPEGFSRLTIHANVLPFIDIQPRILNTGILAYRQEHKFTVTISCPQDEHYVVESITTTNSHASARVLPESSTGNSRTVEITIAPTAAWGGFFSWLEVHARARPTPDAQPVSHTSKIRIQGQVFGELRAEPDAFRFGIAPGVEFVRSLRLHRPGGPFELKSATVHNADIPGTTVTVKKLAPGEYELTMHAVADQLRPLAQGTVVVETDVPGEERIEIPIIGVVRVDNPSVR